jgi:3-hydroxyisobutyrate dehydrogenase
MSSSNPEGTTRLGTRLAKLGVALVDAPVSGGVPRAEAGTLTLMIGGDDAPAIARAERCSKRSASGSSEPARSAPGTR